MFISYTQCFVLHMYRAVISKVTCLLNYIEYFFIFSVQITFRLKWQDDRLTYMHKLTFGDMKGTSHFRGYESYQAVK